MRQKQTLKVEILNTGAELISGDVLNTHQQWLAREITSLGAEVVRVTCVDDRAESIIQAVDEAMARADVVLTTGGLGPTADDRTREAIAAFFGRRLIRDPEIERHVREWYAARNRPVTEAMLGQALVPEGAKILPNRVGTAPGLILEASRVREGGIRRPVFLIMLPGPSRELYPMFEEQVRPWLQQRVEQTEKMVHAILRTTGIPESMVEQQVGPTLQDLCQRGLQVGYCARPMEVDVRLTARGPEAEALVEEAKNRVQKTLGAAVYGEGSEELEQIIFRLFRERGLTLATAESCTGGLLAHRMTNVPGVSEIFMGGAVVYSNRLKEQVLGVPAEMLEQYGAVSAPVARAMAEGARVRFQVDWAVGITGIAGPSGGTPEKPVGTVFIGVAGPDGISVHRFLHAYDRVTFKYVTTQRALDLLRRRLLGLDLPGKVD